MKFDDLIETIDLLESEEIDQVVDWQLTESPAAMAEGRGRKRSIVNPLERAQLTPLERAQRLINEAILATSFPDL